MNKSSIFGILFLLIQFPAIISAQIRLPRLISDGMVLQRDREIKVWGWASPGESVKLTFGDITYTAKADNNGNWDITLPSQKAGGPYDMVFEASNRVAIQNIVFGDVWICSGQSNMELPMARVREKYAEIVRLAENPDIRQFLVPDQYDFKKENKDLEDGEWQSATPETILDFSAVAYFFALELYEQYQVPIGLINAALGGSPVEAWMSEETLREFPYAYEELQKFKDDALIKKIETEDSTRAADWYRTLNAKDPGLAENNSWSSPETEDQDWNTTEIPGYWKEGSVGKHIGTVWFRKTVDIPKNMTGKPARLSLGRIIDQDYVYINGEQVGTTGYQYPPRKYDIETGVLKAGKNTITVRVVCNAGNGGFVPDKPYYLAVPGDTVDLKGTWKYRTGATMPRAPGQTFIRWKPGGLYNKMIAPLFNYSIKGVIWYQGESNTGNPEGYNQTFPAMIGNWREAWKQGDFPFLYVQLANFMEETDTPVESNWAALRQAQLNTLSVPNTGMAVITDLGEWNDIHPLNKKDVGKRLALLARKMAYGEKTITASGPIPAKANFKKDHVIVTFDHTGKGLVTRNNKAPEYFAISADGKNFIWAKAEITGKNTVRVWNAAVSNPVVVRYAWANNPATANLYSENGLPASPFELKK
ncbi:sialate O-acetylesterase [Sinomicrobium sp. M5D2P17]